MSRTEVEKVWRSQALVGDLVLYRGEWWAILWWGEALPPAFDPVEIVGINQTAGIAGFEWADVEALEPAEKALWLLGEWATVIPVVHLATGRQAPGGEEGRG